MNPEEQLRLPRHAAMGIQTHVPERDRSDNCPEAPCKEQEHEKCTGLRVQERHDRIVLSVVCLVALAPDSSCRLCNKQGLCGSLLIILLANRIIAGFVNLLEVQVLRVASGHLQVVDHLVQLALCLALLQLREVLLDRPPDGAQKASCHRTHCEQLLADRQARPILTHEGQLQPCLKAIFHGQPHEPNEFPRKCCSLQDLGLFRLDRNGLPDVIDPHIVVTLAWVHVSTEEAKAKTCAILAGDAADAEPLPFVRSSARGHCVP
mmetsp:Transcript_41382/g.105347  ORF Transcript_41382/g.105347 Transcript_41382/m.105347 type:complete len:263 (+) Transcript_41382:407-1195(+)